MNQAELDRLIRQLSARSYRPQMLLPSDFAQHPLGLPAAVNLSEMRLQALEKAGLNWGIKKGGALQALYAAKLALSNGDEALAQAAVVAECAENPDAYFWPDDVDLDWNAVRVADPDCGSEPQEWDPQALRSCWGARLYRLRRAIFRHSLFLLLGGEMLDGHAIYCNLAGQLYVLACTFDRLGGQAIQVVNRDSKFKDGKCEIENRPLEADPEVVVAGCYIGRTGMADARGSFPISIADVGRPNHKARVSIVNNLLRCDWGKAWIEKSSKAWARSRGGILVDGAGQSDRHNGAVSVLRNIIHLAAPDRQALVVNNAESVLVQGNIFDVNGGGCPYLDVDRLEFDGDEKRAPSGNVVWRKNFGNALLRYRGEVLGPCSGTYRMRDGKVVYRRAK